MCTSNWYKQRNCNDSLEQMFVSQAWRLSLIFVISGSETFSINKNKIEKKTRKVPSGCFKWLFEQLFNYQSPRSASVETRRLSAITYEACKSLRGCSHRGELARLGGLAHLGEMIFIPRSYGIFYLSSIKKFVMSLE